VINILGKRYYFFLLSLLLIVPGLVLMVIKGGLPLSIDFTGGTLLEVGFPNASLPSPADVVQLFNGLDITDVQVTTTGNDTIVIRSSPLDDTGRSAVLEAMSTRFGQAPEVLKFDTVGPTVGQEVTTRAALAVLVAALGVILFITYSFRGIEHSFRYGVCAIIAMLHDALLVISIASIGSHFWGWQIDSLFLTAFLTVIGFSVQDKIVVFDRIRENSSIYRKLPFEILANHSIVQTLQRSINTQLMTSEFMLLAMALFGGVTLREFSIILLAGLLSGTYSSIFIAAPTLVVWETKEWRTWFHRQPLRA
jgi:preprotein translocase subunit SecF